MSLIDQELLWRAWPTGFLAMRGVKTVGGWEIVEVGGRLCFHRNPSDYSGSRYFTAPVDHDPSSPTEYGEHVHEGPRRRGELLPRVDSGDPATWACLLVDLMHACAKRPILSVGFIPTLRQAVSWGPVPGVVVLSAVASKGTLQVGRAEFNVTPDAPIELGLVEARIQLREGREIKSRTGVFS